MQQMQWRIQDFPLGGADLQCVHFLAKTYAKMKKIDPVGGGGEHAPAAPLPGSANEMLHKLRACLQML